MKIAAVDYGDSHTGIAVSDVMEMIATPLCVVNERRIDRCADKVAEKLREAGAQLVIVGNPINMNGTLGERSEICRAFADMLRERLEIPVEMWDERATTLIAHERMNEINKRGKKRRAVIDAAEAAVNLESYLGARANRKERQ